MTARFCPRCGSPFSDTATVPAESLVCPKCGPATAPPIVVPSRTRTNDSGEAPWSSQRLNIRVRLPFDPKAESIEEPPETPDVLILGLAVLAVFLVALIGVVLLAKHLRPWVNNRPAVEQASLQGTIERLQNGKEEDQMEAARAITAMGPDALTAALDKIATGDPVNNRFYVISGAVRAIANSGDQAAEMLDDAVRSPKVNIRAGAVSVLREMSPRAGMAVKPLIAAIGDENAWIRCCAAESLGNFGQRAASATAPLLELLKRSDAFTRRRAIDALGRIGPAAKDAVAPLAKVEKDDPDPAVRHSAYIARLQINVASTSDKLMADSPDDISALVASLQGKDEFSCVAAAKTLGDMGIKAKEAVPALALTLRHKDKWRREAAAKALDKLAPFASEYVPTLQVAAKDPEPEVREAAEKAIEQIEGKQP
jgi:HEAT repeat protein